MDALQISTILRRALSSLFLGVYAADRLPTIAAFPAALVVNTDTAAKSGRHWMAMYMPDKRTVEYYDSYALPPNIHIAAFLSKFPNVLYNKKSIQAKYESSCGPHAIYFLIQRIIHKQSFKRFIQNLMTKK